MNSNDKLGPEATKAAYIEAFGSEDGWLGRDGSYFIAGMQAARKLHPPVADEWVMVPKEVMDRFPEINPSNYGHDDALALNGWGVELINASRPTPPADKQDGDAVEVMRARVDSTQPGLARATLQIDSPGTADWLDPGCIVYVTSQKPAAKDAAPAPVTKINGNLVDMAHHVAVMLRNSLSSATYPEGWQNEKQRMGESAQALLDMVSAHRKAAPAPSEADAEAIGAHGGSFSEPERLAFEAWMKGHCWALCATWNGTNYVSDAEQGGEVDPRAMRTRGLWAAWRDRAALPAPQTEPAPADGLVEFVADLERSRAKYPNNARMFDGLMGELAELRRAYAGDGDVRSEAFDVAVCAFRIATEGDAGGNSTLSAPEQAVGGDVTDEMLVAATWAYDDAAGAKSFPSVSDKAMRAALLAAMAHLKAQPSATQSEAEDAALWNELCRRIDNACEQSQRVLHHVLDDAFNLGSGALEMDIDQSLSALSAAIAAQAGKDGGA